MSWHHSIGHKGPVLRPRCIGTKGARTQSLLYTLYSNPVANVVEGGPITSVSPESVTGG